MAGLAHLLKGGFHGVMVSTQDSESCDPSSNLGGTYKFDIFLLLPSLKITGSILMKLRASAVSCYDMEGCWQKNYGLVRDLNPGPLAP